MVAPYDYRREIATQTDRSKLFFVFINSTACYVLSYLLLHTGYLLVTSWIASTLDVPSVIYYHKIDYRVAANFWTRTRVIFTFGAGPALCFLLGLVMYRAYTRTKKLPGYTKAFFLWGYLHAFNLFFGAYVAGVIAKNGFHYFTNYLEVPTKAEYGIAFFCVAAMFAFGYFATRYFLQLSPSQSLIQRFSRRVFVFWSCVAPWVIGSAILALFKLPRISQNELVVYLMMFTIAVPVIVIQRNFQEVNLVRHEKRVGFSFVYLGATIGALILFRSIFQFGLKIGV